MRKIKKGQYGVGLNYNSPYTQKYSWNNNFGVGQSSGTGLGTVQGSGAQNVSDSASAGGSTSSGLWAKGLGMGASILGSLVDADENSMFQQEQQVGQTLMAINPIVGAAVMGSSALNHALGSYYNTMSNEDASMYGIGKGENTLSKVMAFVGDTTPFAAKLLGRKTHDAIKTKEVDATGGWTGASALINTNQRSGGNFYALGSGRINRGIDRGNSMVRNITKEVDRNSKIKGSVHDNALENESRWLKMMNGDTGTVGQVVGKNGIKLLSKQELAKIYAARKPKESIDSYGDGGKIGVDNNVIPEGALHATKNNLEKVNPELDEVTPKGIPVIVTDDKGEYKQIAEIERDELVLTKEVTLLIEDLWKKGTPEDMIAAGKILAKELMENTVNNGDNKD